MSLYNIVNASRLVAGQPEDVGDVLANLQAIQGVLNGGIDDINVRSTAAIQASKLAGYPSDAKKFLKGDGSWGGTVALGAPTQILNGTVSYVAPTGANFLEVECIGAGGGGAGNASTSAGSNTLSCAQAGGGGGYAFKRVISNIGTHTVVVGAGGTAGTSGGTAGGAGGTTAFQDTTAAVVCQASGGSGGATAGLIATGSAAIMSNAGGTGMQGGTAAGVGTVGDWLIAGGQGWCIRLSASSGASFGGAAPFGGDVSMSNMATASTGNFQAGGSNSYGGGGTGGLCTSTTAVAGAAGANGCIRVKAYA